MNVKRIVSVALALVVMTFLVPVYANAQPPLPHAFYGTVKINGVDAPAYTTTVKATDRQDGTTDKVMTGISNPITITEAGKYGSESPLGAKLVVQGSPDTPIPEGTPIYFFVNGVKAETEPATVEWHSSEITEVNLSVTIAAPPGGGGGGGGDTTPPIISNVGSCPGGVTETTADICWTTNEASTSRVEYWTSPSTLTPLDTSYVTSHHVHITGLTPGTTYHYKTMSQDLAGNLAVSPEYTFTTLGKAPAAAFTISNLSVSPSEVDIGGSVTISTTVTNTGNASGSYEVTLKINGVAEPTKKVTVAATKSESVSFTVSKDKAGIYSVDVNGLKGSFTVKEKVVPTPPPPAAPPVTPPAPMINWPMVGGIIAAVVVVGLVIFFLVRRRAY